MGWRDGGKAGKERYGTVLIGNLGGSRHPWERRLWVTLQVFILIRIVRCS